MSIPLNFINEHGFLIHPDTWTVDIAQAFALQENIVLTEEHWQMIQLFRQLYEEHGHIPIMRVLSKLIASKLGLEKSSMIYLTSLFGENPLRKACKIAGLPKPRHCL